MKIASTIARYLMGLMFTVFGLNGFLHFIPNMPMPPLAGQFIGVLVASHFAIPIFFVQLVCGVLFLINRYIPLALTMIAPVIVNILLFHLLMNPSGIVPGAIVTICWFLVFYRVRSAFSPLFQQKGTPS
jgi:putative oxidoreductase